MGEVAETEKLIREKLQASGQMDKMRAMVIDASLRAIAGSADDVEELFAPGANLRRLRRDDPDHLRKVVSTAVECLHWLGLGYSANVVAIEAGFKPVEFTKRDALLKELALSDEKDAIVGLLATHRKGAAAHHKAAAAPVAKSPPKQPAPRAEPAAPAPVAVKKPHPLSEDSTYIISRWNDREFTRINQVNNQQMNIDYLDRCKLFVLDPLDSTNIDDCNDTEMVFAACEGSIFLRNCKNCVVTAACKQLRTRDCENCEIRLFAGTDPVVESSHHITFKPFNLRLPNLISTFKSAKLDPSVNRFVHVYDFTADDPKLPTPHFTVINDNHGLVMQSVGAQHGIPEAPPQIQALLEGRLKPADSCESGSSKSMNIKTSSQAWKEEEAAAPAEAAAPPPAAASSTSPSPARDSASSKYSSYSDYSSSGNEDEKYKVDEDSDNF